MDTNELITRLRKAHKSRDEFEAVMLSDVAADRLEDLIAALKASEEARKRADAMAQQAADEALERAAQVADEKAVDWWDAYKGNGPHRADGRYEGMSDGAEEVAAAIRAMMKGGA